MDDGSRIQQEDERLAQGDQGSVDPFPPSTPFVSPRVEDEAVAGDPVQEQGSPAATRTPPPGYENVAPELWPDENGKPPELTPELLRRLRGKYFTVRHPLLKDCGHRLDMINEPRHRNCENCWFQWFNSHPGLVEVADQMFRTQGKVAIEGMRGKRFVRMFVRYMATVIHFMKQEGRLPNESSNQATPAEGTPSLSFGGSDIPQ
jgi:hypothetical protein